MADIERPNGIPEKTQRIDRGPEASNGLHPWLREGEHSSKVIPRIVHWIRFNVPRQNCILDVGCGNGKLLKQLMISGYPCLTGIDIEPGHADLASDKLKNTPWKSDLARLHTVWPASLEMFSTALPALARMPQKFYLITCINWLHNDWAHHHAIRKPRTAQPDPQHFDKNVSIVHKLLCDDGILLFDKPDDDNIPDVMSRLGFKLESKYNGFAVFRKTAVESSAAHNGS